MRPNDLSIVVAEPRTRHCEGDRLQGPRGRSWSRSACFPCSGADQHGTLVEGPRELAGDANNWLDDPERRALILDALRSMESIPTRLAGSQGGELGWLTTAELSEAVRQHPFIPDGQEALRQYRSRKGEPKRRDQTLPWNSPRGRGFADVQLVATAI